MLIEEIIRKICDHYNVTPNTVAKKKHGSTPEFTYGEIIRRLVVNPTLGLQDNFPEIGRTTSTALMRSLFNGKQLSRELWGTYLLSILELKKCPQCSQIKTYSEYQKYSSSISGLRNICTECHSSNNKQKYIANPEYSKEYNKQYYLDNKDSIQQRMQEYYQTHKSEYVARSIKYYAFRELATPSWASAQEMNKVYSFCPEGMHVDHIIPLQGENVCGLHTEHNLQYLLAADNISKSNKFDPDTHIHTIEYIPPYENIH